MASIKDLGTIGLMSATLLLPFAAPVHANAGHSPSPATPILAGSCNPNAVKVKVSKNEVSTTSTSFTPVLETDIAFNTTVKSCIIVAFSAEASADANELMIVQAVLDGVLCQPNDNFFVRSNSEATDLADRAMNYVCFPVSPGAHSIVMQYKSSNGGTVTLDYRTTTVSFRK